MTDSAKKIAAHYNLRPQSDRKRRRMSRIISLRSFNNWVKAVLIKEYAKEGDTILDLCCGKGGDLLKWAKSNINQYFGIDIAEVSVEQARTRYSQFRNIDFKAFFYKLDCFQESISQVIPQDTVFDIVSMQFSLHYAFESEGKARMMLRNVTSFLKDGGYFIATIPDANWIVKKWKTSNSLSFGNTIYSIKTEQMESFPAFGHQYIFNLFEAIEECPEYLVNFGFLKNLAAEYGLELLFKERFDQFFLTFIEQPKHYILFREMGVVSDDQSITEEEWEVARIYLAFAMQKTKNQLQTSPK